VGAGLASPVNALLGVEVRDLEDGSVELALATGPEHHNEVGIVHGGITALLLDGAMGRAVGRTLVAGEGCATVQLSVQYLERAEGRLVAHGRSVRRGRTTAFMEAECRRADGRVVARAHGTWVVLPAPAARR
jgi:uncharacterized protein (TIGR00369 family)